MSNEMKDWLQEEEQKLKSPEWGKAMKWAYQRARDKDEELIYEWAEEYYLEELNKKEN